jgi:hypothetical protein
VCFTETPVPVYKSTQCRDSRTAVVVINTSMTPSVYVNKLYIMWNFGVKDDVPKRFISMCNVMCCVYCVLIQCDEMH